MTQPPTDSARRVTAIHDGWAFAPVGAVAGCELGRRRAAGASRSPCRTPGTRSTDRRAAGTVAVARRMHGCIEAEPNRRRDLGRVRGRELVGRGVRRRAAARPSRWRLLDVPREPDGPVSQHGAATLVVIVDNAANESGLPAAGRLHLLRRHLPRGAPDHRRARAFDLDEARRPGPDRHPATRRRSRTRCAHARAVVGPAGGRDRVRFAIDGEATVTVPVVDGEANADDHDRARAPVARPARPAPLHGASRTPRRRRPSRRGRTAVRMPRVRGRSAARLPAERRGVSAARRVAPPGLCEGVGNAITEEMKQTDLALHPGARRDDRAAGALPARSALLRPLRRGGHRRVGRDPADHGVPPRRNRQRARPAHRTDRAEPPPREHHLAGACRTRSPSPASGEDVLAAHRELNDLAHRLDPTRLTAMANLFLLETDHPLVTVCPTSCRTTSTSVGTSAKSPTTTPGSTTSTRPTPRSRSGSSEYGADANPQFQSPLPREGRLLRGVPGALPRAHGRA